MSGTISADTIVGSTKTVSVNTLQQASDVTAAVQGRSGSAGAFSFRNKIVDGRFDFWYEATTQSTNGYGSDTMWTNIHSGSTKVHSQQPLVAGVDLPAIDCPTATYFSRTVVTSVAGAANYVVKTQNIEGVGTLAGKVVTLSFYAKADAVKNIAVTFTQNFGTGGSTAITGIGAQLVSLSTAWKRYSVQVTLPSISGKTLGTGHLTSVLFGFDIGSNYAATYASLGQQSGTFDIACVQLEEGSVATPFEELPMEISEKRVHRYYEFAYINYNGYQVAGQIASTPVYFKSLKRAQPTMTQSLTITNGSAPSAYSNDVSMVSYATTVTASGYVTFYGYVKADARL